MLRSLKAALIFFAAIVLSVGLTTAILPIATLGNAAPPRVLPQVSGHHGACTSADQNAVTLIIDYQNLGGETQVFCASGLAGGAVGMDVLKAVGISIAGTNHDGSGFVCRINGRPSVTEDIQIPGNSSYHENCVNTPPATAYWAYWWAQPGGSWVYSDKGVLAHRVIIGGYEAWSFANRPDGGYNGSNPPPRIAPGLWPVAVQSVASTAGTATGKSNASSTAKAAPAKAVAVTSKAATSTPKLTATAKSTATAKVSTTTTPTTSKSATSSPSATFSPGPTATPVQPEVVPSEVASPEVAPPEDVPSEPLPAGGVSSLDVPQGAVTSSGQPFATPETAVTAPNPGLIVAVVAIVAAAVITAISGARRMRQRGRR